MYKARALSLRERVAEGRVRAIYRTARRTTLTRASRTLSRRERAPALQVRHHRKYILANSLTSRFIHTFSDRAYQEIFPRAGSKTIRKIMGSRAIWTGQLKLGTASIPVKLYAAVQDQDIHFHILDAKTKTRIKQHMVNPDTGEEVAGKEIQKAYEVEKGKFVV